MVKPKPSEEMQRYIADELASLSAHEIAFGGLLEKMEWRRVQLLRLDDLLGRMHRTPKAVQMLYPPPKKER